MTLTTSAPISPAVDAAIFDGIVTDDWVSTSDHRRIGQLHLGLVLGAVIAAASLGVAVHGAVAGWFDLPSSGRGAIDSVLALHQNLWAVAIGMPLWVAVGTLVVPGQIGATRLAFPRMASVSLWGWVVGVATLVTATLVEDGPVTFNVLMSQAPLGSSGAANQATDLAIASLMLIAAATLVGAVNLVATVVTERRPALKLGEVNPFSWSVFVTMAVSIVSTPVFIAGLFLTYLDQHFGSQFFASGAGADRAWVHMVWLFGRPETLLIALPAVGAVAGIIVARTGRPLVGGSIGNALLTAAGCISISVWAGRELIAGSLIQPYSRFWVALVVIPLFLLLLLILGSVRGGLKPDVSLLFALGVLLSIVLGALITVVLITRDLTPDTAGAAQFGLPNLLIFGVALLGALGMLVETAADGYGRSFSKIGSTLGGLAVLGGVLLSGAGLALGSFSDDAKNAHAGAALGKGLIAAGASLVVLTILGSAFGRQSNASVGNAIVGSAPVGGASSGAASSGAGSNSSEGSH